MTNQIKPSVTNPTIADIYEKIDTGRLQIAPDFQRKFVWTHEHQEEFLDTLVLYELLENNNYIFHRQNKQDDDYIHPKLLQTLSKQTIQTP